MVDLWTFAHLFSDLTPGMVMIDGRLFLDRYDRGMDALRAEMARYEDAHTAQRWINSVPIDDLINCAVEHWSVDDAAVQDIADVFARSWMALIKSRFGSEEGYSVEVLKDREHGDVWGRLNQAVPP